MLHAISLLFFFMSISVGFVGSFFLGNSFDSIGYQPQNRTGGIIGASISGVLFILGCLSLSRDHRGITRNNQITHFDTENGNTNGTTNNNVPGNTNNNVPGNTNNNVPGNTNGNVPGNTNGNTNNNVSRDPTARPISYTTTPPMMSSY